jgi:hypothetical protein
MDCNLNLLPPVSNYSRHCFNSPCLASIQCGHERKITGARLHDNGIIGCIFGNLESLVGEEKE